MSTGDVRLGCHLVSWPRFRTGLDAAAALGVEGCESFADVALRYEGREDELGRLLRARRLSLCALYADIAVGTPGTGSRAATQHLVARAAALAAAVGGDRLVVTAYPETAPPTAVAAALDAAGTVAAGHGVRLCLHAHAGSAVATTAALTAVLGHTDPAAVALCLDTAHVAAGGGDPVRVVEHHADRIAHVHLHDVDPSGRSCVVGRGAARVAATVAALQAVGYRGWAVVEVEDAEDPTGGVRASLELVEGMGWERRRAA